jgi:CheY-like chemotaxis protein
MTANAFQEDIKKAEEAGMNGHIAKPLDIPAMKATLQHVLKNTGARW